MILQFIWAKVFKKIQSQAILNSQIHKTSKVEAGSSVVNSKFDRHSFCGYNCEISNAEIGSFCSIANGVIIGGGMHPMEWVGMSPVFYEGRDSVKRKFSTFKRTAPKKTIIRNDVWIGNNVLIKQGVTIGNGAVIGMGSVVTKDVEDYSVVAGVPSKEIKKRFDKDMIEQLVEIKWWNLPDNEIDKYARFFNSPKVFIKEYLKKN
jgi:acetyltransferase-like isoleucine patch superfamily enzyme